MNRLVAIVGPTGTGKSRLAIYLARRFHGEIVNADSRLVYRYLDIGTAKPSPEELAEVPHHLVNIIDPDEDFNLARYQQLATAAIVAIQQKNRLPLLAGGSGLYIRAVLEGWQVPEVPPDPALRRRLEDEASRQGTEPLYRELLAADPEAAQKIDPRNVRRVIRALEVQQQTGRPFSQFQRKVPPPYDTCIVGLTVERKELYRRLDRRVDEMMARGLVGEVEKIAQMGYDLKLPALSSIGYRQVIRFMVGELTLEEAVQQIKNETHRLVRQQNAWFQEGDERIHWFDIETSPDEEIAGFIAEFLRGMEQEKGRA
ncbi:MAG: tRNA (adenosine(37)-N6)-dimethylallyltransferase MiaA [Chloroflexota bacterium]